MTDALIASLPRTVQAALDEISEPRRERLLGFIDRHEVCAAMLRDCHLFGANGAKYFERHRPLDGPFIIQKIGILLSGKDVGKWDTDPEHGEIRLTIDALPYFTVPLAAMPSHAGPIWQRRVELPIVPHPVLLLGETFLVEIEWPDAPSVMPMVFLDGWQFRPH